MPREVKGIIIPAVTPFEKDGAVSIAKLAANYTKWNETKVAGYMCLGSNGEFRSLSDDEALRVIEAAAQYTARDKVLIAGVGRESLHHTLQFIDRVQAAQVKLDYISVLTPSYFAKLMTDAALVAYFEAVADHSRYPVLLYCAPGFTNGVCISAEALKRLADHPNIFGIKDTSATMMNAYMDAVGGREDFAVLAGSLDTIMSCLARGGKGGVVSAANYYPAECAKLVEVFEMSGLEKANAYHALLQKRAKRTGGRASIAGVKCCMNLVGLQGGYTRQPILPVAPEIEAQIRQAVQADKTILREV